MGCVSSKKVLRTNSFQQNLHRPFPRVAAIPILEDFLLANNPDQFVALICKTTNFTKKLNAEIESLPSFVSEDDEGKEAVSENPGTEGLDFQMKNSLEEEEPEKHRTTQEKSEQNNAREVDRPVFVINTLKLMAGLEDDEAGQTLTKQELMAGLEDDEAGLDVDNVEMPRVSVTPRRSKPVECFHTLEEYDSFLATNRDASWNRYSKRYLYYLGHNHSEMVTESASSQLFKTSSLPSLKPKPRSMAAIVIDWNEDSKDDGNCASESSVVKASLGQSDTRIEVSSQENINAEGDANKNSNEEKNHIPETNIGQGSPTDTNLKIKQYTQGTSSKSRLHERAKVNELRSINIPSSPDLSAVGSLRDWLYSGGNLYSPGVSTTPCFGSYGYADQWPKLENNSNSWQFLTDEAEIEIRSCGALDDNEAEVNIMELGAYCDSSLSPIEDFPLFDPELLASFEKALEQLSEEEKCIMQHIDEHLNLSRKDFYPEDSKLILQDSSEDIQIQNKFHSNQEQNSHHCEDAEEMFVAS